MRQWFVGSIAPPFTLTGYPMPTKAFTYFQGIRNTTDGVRYGYPVFLTDNRFAEIMSRIRQWSITLSWQISGILTTSGDTIDETGSWTSVTILNTAFNETNLFDSISSSGVQNGFGVTVTPYDVTRIVNGVPSTIASQTQGNLVLVGDTSPAGPVTPYTYRTDTRLWLPRIEFGQSTDNGFLNQVETAFDSPPPTDFHLETFTGSFNGLPMEVHCYIPDGLSLDSATLLIDPVLWFEYASALTGQAIYDAETGAILPGQTPITQQL